MNIITKFTITGFWGTRRLSIRLNPDVNFLIGVNGTGKTTVINMLASALNADFTTLDKLSFDKISIDLRGVKDRTKSLIEVTKKPRAGSPFPEINYCITDRSSGERFFYSLDSFEEQHSFREYPARPRPSRSRRRETLKLDLIEHLKRLVNVSWLSIHRSEKTRIFAEERSYESSIDQKLDELSREFAGHLSLINRQGDNETAIFQQRAFLSLISKQTMDDLFSTIPTMDLQAESKALVDIFRKFQVDDSTFYPVINTHFEAVERARKLLVDGDSPLDVDSAITLITMLTVHLVVQEWINMINRQEKIFEPRDTFLNTINEMLISKTLNINERNEFLANASPNKVFTLHQLSSGEKQLFIILGQALLQRKAPWIYIADEPELSLHVTWQSQLIDSLRNINPNAQIIVATHSPDIVAHYDSKTIDMEAIIK